MMLSILLATVLATAPGAFPVPGEKGQHIDPHATRFHLPHGMAQVEHFYRAQFRGEPHVIFLRGHDEGGDTLTIRSSRPGDSWTRAILHDEGVATTVVITPLITMDDVAVRGTPPPVVALVIERSEHVQEQLRQITDDHAPTR